MRNDIQLRANSGEQVIAINAFRIEAGSVRHCCKRGQGGAYESGRLSCLGEAKFLADQGELDGTRTSAKTRLRFPEDMLAQLH